MRGAIIYEPKPSKPVCQAADPSTKRHRAKHHPTDSQTTATAPKTAKPITANQTQPRSQQATAKDIPNHWRQHPHIAGIRAAAIHYIALSETLRIFESAHTSLRYASVGLEGFLKTMFPSASTLHIVLETAITKKLTIFFVAV